MGDPTHAVDYAVGLFATLVTNDKAKNRPFEIRLFPNSGEADTRFSSNGVNANAIAYTLKAMMGESLCYSIHLVL